MPKVSSVSERQQPAIRRPAPGAPAPLPTAVARRVEFGEPPAQVSVEARLRARQVWRLGDRVYGTADPGERELPVALGAEPGEQLLALQGFDRRQRAARFGAEPAERNADRGDPTLRALLRREVRVRGA